MKTIYPLSFFARLVLILLLVLVSLPATGAGATSDLNSSSVARFAHTGDLTPVTLSYFSTRREGNQVTFEWSTATETGNIGFNIYAEQNGQRVRLNKRLIVSKGMDSLSRQDYSFAAATGAESFFLEEVNFLQEKRWHGPFLLGREIGKRGDTARIDWDAIHREQNAMTKMISPQVVSAAPTTPLWLKVNQTGLQRVTHAMLLAAGYNLVGVNTSNIRMTSQGQPVPIYIKSGVGGLWATSSYIEFYGQALDTLYTDTNVYILDLATGGARIPSSGTLPTSLPSPSSYTETLNVNNQNAYAIYALGSDPWYDTYMQIDDRPNAWEYHFSVSSIADLASSASMSLTLWGLTQWPANPDHHIVARVNGVQVGDLLFDGFSENVFNLTIPGGTLQNGDNVLRLEFPADQGLMTDVVTLDKFSVTYQRSFQAVDGRLSFTVASPNRVIQVNNLPNNNVVVYRMTSTGPVRLTALQVQATGSTYRVRFAATTSASQYFVSTVSALHAPAAEIPPTVGGLDTPAQYLIISHPDFLGSLSALVSARQSQGFTVNVVNVEHLYAQYSYGVFDPQAIRDYIAYARANLGTQYVLLVGGDTFDYRNYLGVNSIPFIPSLYADVGAFDNFVPADPLYADTNGDNLPNFPIGRLPVRTTTELATLINKTLAYQTKSYGQTAVFLADAVSGAVSFKATSQSQSAGLPGGWTITNLFLDDISVATANTQLLAAINNGTALVNYNGHSSASQWAFPSVFNMTDAAALTNSGKPFVGTFFGCWNTYYVDPVNDGLLQTLLLGGDFGAAAILGTSSRADSESMDLLGFELYNSYLSTPGATIGNALAFAKGDLFLTRPELTDAFLTFTIMGDPALVVTP